MTSFPHLRCWWHLSIEIGTNSASNAQSHVPIGNARCHAVYTVFVCKHCVRIQKSTLHKKIACYHPVWRRNTPHWDSPLGPFRKKPNGPQTKSRPFSLARRNREYVALPRAFTNWWFLWGIVGPTIPFTSPIDVDDRCHVTFAPRSIDDRSPIDL